MADQTDVRERVLRESERFREALPDLLKEHAGKWVIFLDGVVRGVFGSEAEAYVKAVEQFGLFGGFVVAPVEEERPVPMTAALMFAR